MSLRLVGSECERLTESYEVNPSLFIAPHRAIRSVVIMLPTTSWGPSDIASHRGTGSKRKSKNAVVFSHIRAYGSSDVERLTPPNDTLHLIWCANLRTASRGSSPSDQNQTRACGAWRSTRASKSHQITTNEAQICIDDETCDDDDLFSFSILQAGAHHYTIHN
uniref:SFRICE_021830 n=1 Tax=Spodoptera frugiperda TaxID=7108 RepID=A0A2H1VSB9_SPOFR